MKNTQQAGICVALALTTAMLLELAPHRHEAGPYHYGALHSGLVPFLMAGMGLLLLLPPLRLFFRWRWLILLTVATAGLLGNFVFFSTLL